jgi:hypothetical protein
VLCYSYFDFVRSVVGEEQVPGVIRFTLLHEVGHALVHDLELPVLGREEDAADRFAAAYLLAGQSERALWGLTSAAQFFHELGSRSANSMWDQHSSDRQRYGDLVCQLYGASPRSYAKYFGASVLPGERAARCGAEYRLSVGGWNALLERCSRGTRGVTFALHVPTDDPPVGRRHELPPPPPAPPSRPLPLPRDVAPVPPPPPGVAARRVQRSPLPADVASPPPPRPRSRKR